MLDFFYETQHLVFTIPFFLGLALSLLSAISLFSVDAAIDHDGHWHVHLEHGHTSPDSFGSAIDGFMSFVGVGVIPFMLWLNILCLIFGITGIIGVSVTGLVWVIAPICLLLSLFITGRIARILKPLGKDYGIPKNSLSLLGKIATAVSGEVSKDFGLIQYRDEKGHSFKLDAVNGGDETIHQGDKVVISDIKDNKEIYIVFLFKE